MLIVVSDAGRVADEAKIINELFEAGLAILHLRKPEGTLAENRQLISKIDEQHHSKLALHQHHELHEEFGINRLHFTTTARLAISESRLQALQEAGMVLSTSIHSYTEYSRLSSAFSYAFLGPVFNSISKQGYTAQPQAIMQARNSNDVKLIAIGGIEADNLQDKRLQYFDGVALLGAVWQSDTPLKTFKRVQERWSTVAQQY